MNFIEKNRSKISMFLGGTVFALVLVAIIIALIGLDSESNNTSNGALEDNNTRIQSFYDKANEEFENGNLREMQIQLGKLQQEFPEEDVQPFIDEKLSSLPTIQATDLSNEYKENEVKCNLDYKNKLLKVSGKVSSIGEDIMGTVYITLGNDKLSLYNVRCEFEYEEEISQVATLKKGDIITVLGTYEEVTSMCPRLKNAYILDK